MTVRLAGLPGRLAQRDTGLLSSHACRRHTNGFLCRRNLRRRRQSNGRARGFRDRKRWRLRASKKLRTDELLVTGFAATRLQMELDRVPLWRGDHVAIKQLVEDFARYLYLPRLKEPAVLIEAIGAGLGLLTWSRDSFAYAESFDEAAGRYRGLRCGEVVNVSEQNHSGLLVRADVAEEQRSAETKPVTSGFAELAGESPSGPVALAVTPSPTGNLSETRHVDPSNSMAPSILIPLASGATPDALPTK